jgi:hypothetical protein
LVRNWEIEGCKVPIFSPVTAGLSSTVQEYLVPAGIIFPLPSTGVTENASPEQILAVSFSISGVGFTVTVTVKVPPEQEPPKIGVTVYTIDCGLVVLFRRVWLMEACGVV